MLKKHKGGKKKVFSMELSLPRNFQYKIFASLYKELGCTGAADVSPFVDDISGDPFIKEVGLAIRHRSTAKLRAACANFHPQCMVESEYFAQKFFAKYQLASFLKKYPETGDDSRTKAIEKFHLDEQTCSSYNEYNHRALLALDEKHPSFLGIIQEIQNDILGLLGDFPNLDTLVGLSKHGPGTSVESRLYKMGKVTSFYKWSSLPYTVTPLAVPYAKMAISSDPRWIGALDDWYRRQEKIKIGYPINVEDFWSKVLKVVRHSRVATVPKSAEIDRTICIEPLLNVYLQLGVDGIIRSRLKKRWGYDLNDQSRNQNLAKQGSIDGTLATVDLSSASDLISLKICEVLLPPAWYDLLFDLRSAATVIDGKMFPLSKISSMGNGYTFAIESLIFGALTRCAIRRSKSLRISSVYGDDIVLPSTAYPLLKELLELCGFRVNADKTFTTGPFRESCGMDFFKGANVRPLFLKKKIEILPDLLYLHNALWALEDRLHWSYGFDFSGTRRLIRKYVPDGIRKYCYGPPSESLDTYLFSNRPLARTEGGYAWGLRVIARPFSIKGRYKDFFFRKLMCDLRGVKTRDHAWDLKRKPNTGNAFDITRRDFVGHKLTKCKVWPQ